MIHVLFAFLVYAFAALQVVLPNELGSTSPTIVPLMAVVAGLAIVRLEGSAAIVWAATAGLIGDCLSTEPLGIEMAAATIVAFTVRRSSKGRRLNSSISAALLAALTTFVIVCAASLVRVVFSEAVFSSDLAITVTTCAAMSACVAIFVTWFVLTLSRFGWLFTPSRSSDNSDWLPSRSTIS